MSPVLFMKRSPSRYSDPFCSGPEGWCQSEKHHSFSHLFRMHLLKICHVPGTILSPREGYTPSLTELAFWQRGHSAHEEIKTDARLEGRKRAERREGWHQKGRPGHAPLKR